MKRVETYEPGPGAEGNAGTGGAASGRREASPESHSFVKFFMQASPYIAGHRGKTFVVVVPGEGEGVGWGMCWDVVVHKSCMYCMGS